MEAVVLARLASMRDRIAMYNANALKIGVFGANCSSGRSATKMPERWSASWPDCRRLARMADEAGIDFILPIGRWKGYGGDTDFHGSTLETVTWAVGLLSVTERITVFGTVHAPLFHPLIAAKEFVTADHVGEGRFGVNLVVGWNEGEFEMFGVTQREHDARYAFAQEWLDVVKRAWSERGNFDFHGEFLQLNGVRAYPKPYGDTRPILMNAGSSQVGQAFALRNCDAFFVATSGSRTSLEGNVKKVAEIKSQAQSFGRDIEVYTVGQVICRASQKEGRDRRHAREQAHHAADDWARGIRDQTPVLCGERDRRLSVRRNAGPRGGGTRKHWQSRHAWHRPFLRQLPR
jgi:dimethylsulfone monooxygenase